MMDLDFLERLIKALDESSLDSLEIERGGTRVKLGKTSQHSEVVVPAPGPAVAAPPSEASPPASHLVEIESPMVGTFYRGPAPDAPPYVKEGMRVGSGDTLCIIEAMKLMNELECEVEGTIVEICVENAQPVEFGQVLFRVDPT
jgi:acetyl-CoA carboxylase biotin carboxyl carrier protein